MRRAIGACALLICVLSSTGSRAAEPIDGTYDATVTTSSGVYHVPVEVDGGEVTHVYWPNGGRMSVRGGELDDGYATGVSSRGDRVRIEVDDLEYDGGEE